MKRYFTMVVLFMGLLSCNPNEPADLDEEKLRTFNAGEYLVFGEYYGFCPPQSDCARVYKIEGDHLYGDTINRMGGARSSITYSSAPLPSEKYTLAAKLLSSIPQELFASNQETFGSPDAYDQGGIVIEIQDKGVVKRFYIDTTVDSLPEFLKSYITQVKEVLAQLK